MVHELITLFLIQSFLEKEQIAWEIVFKLFMKFIGVAAILALPKHRVFTWNYRSSTHRVHLYTMIEIRGVSSPKVVGGVLMPSTLISCV